MSRHALWDALPGFPDGLDPDDPEHLHHPIVASLIGSGGRWQGREVGWCLADPRLILAYGPGTEPDQRSAFLRELEEKRQRLLEELEAAE